MEIISLCGGLGVLAWEDWKTKEIHVGAIAALGVLGVLFHLYLERLDILEVFGGFGIGVLLYGISILSKGAIGKGDGLCFMATGIYLGFWNNLFLLWSSFLVAGIVGLVYGKIRGLSKKTQLPFLPYVFVCLVLQLVLGGGL